jgi:predicted SprT family Zn-dependent metalloprotease
MPLTQHQARSLGNLLCTTTAEILWQPARGWIRERHPGTQLECRVGAGQATYHRFNPHQRQHRITFGARMIIAKHRPDTAAGWLSSREIQGRGYFDGELSTLNLLAHTCCHEFAHLLQHVAGKRLRGSVHNRHFYDILDELHASGAAQAVRSQVREAALDHGLCIPAEHFEIASPADMLADWRVGDAVGFGAGAQHRHGLIKRINRKTCTVDGSGRWQGLRYRVPAQLLHRLPDGLAEQ